MILKYRCIEMTMISNKDYMSLENNISMEKVPSMYVYHYNEWMNGVLGNDSAISRLYWAGDNLGEWDEFRLSLQIKGILNTSIHNPSQSM